MSIAIPVRLGPAETKLIEQLNAAGATAEAERLGGSGLPTRKVEAYHYTDLKQLLRDRAGAGGRSAGRCRRRSITMTPPALTVPGAFQLVIANGRVQKHGTAPAGVIAGKTKGGVLATRDDIVTRLNNALVNEALTLDLDGSVDPVIQIDRRTEGAAGHSASAAKIFVGDDASAVIVETYSGCDEAHLGNHATYLALGKNAKVTHITVNLAGKSATHFASQRVPARRRRAAPHAGDQRRRRPEPHASCSRAMPGQGRMPTSPGSTSCPTASTPTSPWTRCTPCRTRRASRCSSRSPVAAPRPSCRAGWSWRAMRRRPTPS